MSLFADKWPSPFDSNPFGLDNFHSSTIGGFRLGSSSSFFGDSTTEEETLPSKMKIRNAGPSLAEQGFYDHFDSVFHDLASPGSRRYNLRSGGDSSRHSPQPNGRGKEYVIPIKIETSSTTKTSSSSSDKEKSRAVSSTRQSAGSDKMIEIPIVRQTGTLADQKNCRSKSRSPVVSDAFQAPSNFTLLTPTTEQHRGSQSKNSADDIYLDSDAFFTKSRNTPRQSQSKENSDIEVEEETIRSSLRRKPLRHLGKDAAEQVSSRSFGTSQIAADSSKRLSSSKSDVHKNDVRPREEAKRAEREEAERERRQPLCSNLGSGSTDVTPSPSYPIYDHLRPRLAKVGRQVDYIRGDGNCFFRALSKEMYGTEDYHAEWRQAVCDLIDSHPNVFSQYIDGSSVSSHVRLMRILGTWATTCEIYATATLLRREVYVLAPAPSNTDLSCEYNWLLFSPRSLTGSSAGGSMSRLATDSTDSSSSSHDDELHPCYLTLCHTNGNHYDRITPVFARCNCELPPPGLNGVSVLLDLTASDEEELMRDS